MIASHFIKNKLAEAIFVAMVLIALVGLTYRLL